MMKKTQRNLALLSLAGLALSGCGSSPAETSASTSDKDVLKIVTTTDVYADIVRQIAGDDAEVSALITSTAQDPHSYEATAQDRLAVKDADLVVLNGGGYDLFLEDMAGVDQPEQKVINAVKASGLMSEAEHEEESHDHDHEEEGHDHDHDHAHEHGSFNEHVWYDLDSMKKLADELATALGEERPEQAENYQKAAEDFKAKLDQLLDEVQGIKAEGKKFIATESVPAYLLEDAGYQNSTPADLISAVEDESDIAPLTLKEVKDSLGQKQADLLAFNQQTETNQTKEILAAAKDAGVPHVSFTETLPEGKSYLDWMATNVSELKKAGS